MKKILLLTVLAIAARPGFASYTALRHIGLLEGMKSGKLEVCAQTNNETFYGHSLSLFVENKTKEDLEIQVEPGMIFRPEDSTQQDLVLPGEEVLALAPRSSGAVAVATFCAKMHAHAPTAYSGFHFLKMADQSLQHVLASIRSHKQQNFSGQQLVWAVTDGGYLSYNSNLSFVPARTGAAPVHRDIDYFRTTIAADHKADENGFEGAIAVKARLSSVINASRKLSLAFYDELDQIVQPVFLNREFRAAEHVFLIDYSAAHIRKGVYYLRLSDGSRVLEELRLTAR